MIFNKRVEERLTGQSDDKTEYRVLPQHMYGGPKGMGDPNFRGLGKMEEDPLITNRIRDISRIHLCPEATDEFNKCAARYVSPDHHLQL